MFSIKLRQRLPKSFCQLRVKNSRLFLSYFLKRDDWPKTYTGPRLPTLPYINNSVTNAVIVKSIYPIEKIYRSTRSKYCPSPISKANIDESLQSYTPGVSIVL